MSTLAIYAQFLASSGVSTDTRTIQQNQIFFALSGEHFNGNKFAKSALDAGAKLAIIDDPNYAIADKTILVDNVLIALQQLAQHHRNQFDIPVLAITGSNGKTTSKELLYTVLSTTFNTLATTGNFNNHIGVPLTLLRLNKSHQFAIIEMGANHPGEIAELCRIANPNFGCITNVGKAHLEGFGSFEGVVNTKCELYESLQQHNGHAFVASDQEILINRSNQLSRTTYGLEDAEQEVMLTKASPTLSLTFATDQAEYKQLNTNLIGQYNFNNVAFAITVGRYFKIETTKLVQSLEQYQSDNNRSQLVNKYGAAFILDAYNANPSSMSAAIDNLIAAHHQTKIAILGDMLELGSYSAEEHQNIVTLLEKSPINHVALVGEHFGSTDTKLAKFQSVNEIPAWLKNLDLNNALILLKGSRKIGLERIIDLIDQK